MEFPKNIKFGKKSTLLKSPRQGLKTLEQSKRTINDYAKEVPTNPPDSASPLLVDLLRKPRL